jgi:hypothetical protein
LYLSPTYPKVEDMTMTTPTQQAYGRTRRGFDPAETIVLAISALVGVGANVALAAALATFLYVLVTLA